MNQPVIGSPNVGEVAAVYFVRLVQHAKPPVTYTRRSDVNASSRLQHHAVHGWRHHLANRVAAVACCCSTRGGIPLAVHTAMLHYQQTREHGVTHHQESNSMTVAIFCVFLQCLSLKLKLSLTTSSTGTVMTIKPCQDVAVASRNKCRCATHDFPIGMSRMQRCFLKSSTSEHVIRSKAVTFCA